MFFLSSHLRLCFICYMIMLPCCLKYRFLHSDLHILVERLGSTYNFHPLLMCVGGSDVCVMQPSCLLLRILLTSLTVGTPAWIQTADECTPARQYHCRRDPVISSFHTMEPLRFDTYADASRVEEAGQSFSQSKYCCLPKLIRKHMNKFLRTIKTDSSRHLV